MLTCWDFGGVELLPRQFVYWFSGDKVKGDGVRGRHKGTRPGGVTFKAAGSRRELNKNATFEIINWKSAIIYDDNVAV